MRPKSWSLGRNECPRTGKVCRRHWNIPVATKEKSNASHYCSCFVPHNHRNTVEVTHTNSSSSHILVWATELHTQNTSSPSPPWTSSQLRPRWVHPIYNTVHRKHNSAIDSSQTNLFLISSYWYQGGSPMAQRASQCHDGFEKEQQEAPNGTKTACSDQWWIELRNWIESSWHRIKLGQIIEWRYGIIWNRLSLPARLNCRRCTYVYLFVATRNTIRIVICHVFIQALLSCIP